MATTTIINDLIDLNQTGNTTALKGCVGTNAQQPAIPTMNVQYLVVGGGGGGGSNGTASGDGLGGGGAGGFSTGTIAVPNNTAVNIVVGQGGLGGGQTSDESGVNGQDSGFYQIQGQGGGGGGEGSEVGSPGGSGGGGGRNSGNLTNTGVGVSGQGNSGGLGGYTGGSFQVSSGGGGGGASAVGTAGGNTQSSAGAGGAGSDAVALGIITQANGITANIGEVDGGTLNFSGGGGGGQASSGAANDGGLGGGGNGGTNSIGLIGTANTGGGGGGDGSTTQGGGGTGGSGVVILKYANTATETIAGSLAGGITTGTTSECNYPATASAVNLFQFNDDVTDTCGNNDGAAVNAAYATGNFGNAYDFSANTTSYSGTSSFITFTDDMSYQNNFSWSFWVKSTSGPTNYATIASFYGSYVNYIYFDPTIDKIYLELGDGSGASFDTGMTSGNNWYHCVLTKSSTAGRAFYVNGNSVFSDGITTNSSNTVGRTGNAIGMHWSSSLAWDFPLNGNTLIDQFRIFNSALTADQVGMLYAENIGATKFTESSDTVLVFKGGSGTISLTDSSLPGPKVGDLRTNTDQSSNSSASAMEHFVSTGWRVFDATPNPSSGICNYPTTATALYQLNDNANDTCVSAYNGTASNMTWGTGKFGKCGIFNGNQTFASASRILLPDAVDQFPMSVSCWIYLNGLATSNLGAVIFEGQQGMGLNFTGGNPTYLSAQAQNSQTGQVDSNSALTTGQWYFVVGIFNSSSSAELYIDNVAQSGSSSIDYLTSDENAIGARDHYGYPGTFDGKIDQLRIFPSALTTAQMTQLYNET